MRGDRIEIDQITLLILEHILSNVASNTSSPVFYYILLLLPLLLTVLHHIFLLSYRIRDTPSLRPAVFYLLLSPISSPHLTHFQLPSSALFLQDAAPGKVCVVGAGYVALECAGFLNGLHQVQYGQEHGTRTPIHFPRDLLSFIFPSFLFFSPTSPASTSSPSFCLFLSSYATLPLFSTAPHLRLFPPSSSLL
jgi:hypothetical protein